MVQAEKCHLIDNAVCKEHEKFKDYKDDENNHLAMSRDLHGFFLGLNIIGRLPLFKLDYVRTFADKEFQNRYKVEISVEAFDFASANLIFPKLNLGSTISQGALKANTFVYVLNPTTFKLCLDWKSKSTQEKWDEKRIAWDQLI